MYGSNGFRLYLPQLDSLVVFYSFTVSNREGIFRTRQSRRTLHFLSFAFSGSKALALGSVSLDYGTSPRTAEYLTLQATHVFRSTFPAAYLWTQQREHQVRYCRDHFQGQAYVFSVA